MVFHVVSLPHTQTTKKYNACAYTQKVRKFCIMMKSLGHKVYLYAGEENEAPCDELITCISKEKQQKAIAKVDNYVNVSFDPTQEHWLEFNGNAIREIKKRREKQDFLCIIGGTSNKVIADSMPDMMCVEFGIGYGGTFSKFRVFESYTWMHYVYANQYPNETASGSFYDCVIPNYFEVEDFPFKKRRKDYYLFIGRMIGRKGVNIAGEVCRTLGKKLYLAGPGDPQKTYGEYVGIVDTTERARLMSEAKAVFVPTIYIEPFGGVAVEAMLCGTPIITTDWGAFVEYNKQGVTGYRCRTKGEFMEAVSLVDSLDKKAIRDYAISHFSLDRVKYQYEAYFKQLLSLWNKGWETEWSGLKYNRYINY